MAENKNLSVGAGFKICCPDFLERLRPFIHLVVAENNDSTSQVWLSSVSLNLFSDLFSRRICLSCVVQELSHILNLGPVFPF